MVPTAGRGAGSSGNRETVPVLATAGAVGGGVSSGSSETVPLGTRAAGNTAGSIGVESSGSSEIVPPLAGTGAGVCFGSAGAIVTVAPAPTVSRDATLGGRNALRHFGQPTGRPCAIDSATRSAAPQWGHFTRVVMEILMRFA